MPDNDTVTVVMTITKKDYAEATRAMMARHTSRLWNILFWVSLAVLAYFAYEAMRSRAISDVSTLLWLPGLLVFAGLLKFAAPILAARSFVRKNPTVLGPITQTVGPTGVSTESARGQSTSAWNAYQRVRETRDLFLLYAQSNFAIIVPKRCFDRPDDVQKYREIIRRHCPGTLELEN